MEETALLPEQHLRGRSEDEEEDGSATASRLPLVNHPPPQPVPRSGVVTGTDVKLMVSVHVPLVSAVLPTDEDRGLFFSPSFAFFSQGHFPQMENIAAFKPVSTSPTRSTCGVPERGSYCQSASSRGELMTCYQAFCVQECPYRSTTLPHAPLLLPAHRCVKLTAQPRHFKNPRRQPQKQTGKKNKLWIVRFDSTLR